MLSKCNRSPRGSLLPAVRKYRASRRFRDRCVRALCAGFDGIWLGLLSDEHLRQLDEAFYSEEQRPGGASNSFIDDGYNSRGLDDWEESAIAQYFPQNGRIVVTAAGGGREVLALLQNGFDAVGYEPNERLVAAGDALLRAQGHAGRLHTCARDAFPASAGSCDAVLVGWGSYVHVLGRDRRVRFLRGARDRLCPGDPILLSFFERPRTSTYFRVVARLANQVRRARGQERVEMGDVVALAYAHYFTRDELAAELLEAGFEVETYERRPYAHAVARAV